MSKNNERSEGQGFLPGLEPKRKEEVPTPSPEQIPVSTSNTTTGEPTAPTREVLDKDADGALCDTCGKRGGNRGCRDCRHYIIAP